MSLHCTPFPQPQTAMLRAAAGTRRSGRPSSGGLPTSDVTLVFSLTKNFTPKTKWYVD